jgi:hypothetical protein
VAGECEKATPGKRMWIQVFVLPQRDLRTAERDEPGRVDLLKNIETFSLDSRSKYVVIGQLGNKLKFCSDTFQEIPHAVTFAHKNLLVRGT